MTESPVVGLEAHVEALLRERHEPDDMALATWWVQATPGTTYYRCQVPASVLRGQCLLLKYSDIDPFMARNRGAAIWQFPGNATRGIFMSELKEQGVKVLVEVDDLYLVPAPQIPGYASSQWRWRVDREFGSDDHSKEAHAKLARFADGIIVSTPRLADHYRKLNRNVYVCPNSIQTLDWPQRKKPDDGILRIGYAYSTSHYHDFKLIAPALEWAASQPDVEVVMIGDRWDMTWFDRVPHKHVGWMESLEQYRETLYQLDIGLAPLRENTWSACKSDVKALEYAMAGALPVVQRAEPYRPWFDWTFVCETEKDWLKTVKYLVQNRDYVRPEAEAARRLVLDARTIEKNIHLWEEAVS